MKAWLCSSKASGVKKRLVIMAHTRDKAIELAKAHFGGEGSPWEFSTCVLLDADGLEEVVYEFIE